MELLSFKNILILLIFFEKIFSKININKTSENENFSLKEKKEFNPLSDFFISIPKIKSKCVHDFDLYDISGLLKKSSREDADYIANINSLKIIYNFKDLKKIDICNYDGKQIFLISETCQPLADSIGEGNKWYITEDLDNKNEIEIELNPENKNYSVEYILKCGNIKNYDIDEEKSYFNYTNGVHKLLLYIETSYACPKYEYFIISAWVDNIRKIIGLLLIFISLPTIFTMDIYPFFMFECSLSIFFIILFIVQIFIPPQTRFWKIWLIIISSFIFSYSLMIFLEYFLDKKFIIYFRHLLGVFLGFYLAQFFFDFFIDFIPWNSLFIYILFIFLFSIFGVIISFLSFSSLIFLNSSLLGAYFLIRGVSLMAGYFPNEYILVFLKINGEIEQIRELITWRFYVYNSVILGLTIFTFLMQYLYNKKDWNNFLDSFLSNNLL